MKSELISIPLLPFEVIEIVASSANSTGISGKTRQYDFAGSASASTKYESGQVDIQVKPSTTTSSSKASTDSANSTTGKHAILRIIGPDQKGIVAAFAQLLHGHGCNIVDSEQHSSEDVFFQRICFDYATLYTDRQTIETGIKDVCRRFGMNSGRSRTLSQFFASGKCCTPEYSSIRCNVRCYHFLEQI